MALGILGLCIPPATTGRASSGLAGGFVDRRRLVAILASAASVGVPPSCNTEWCHGVLIVLLPPSSAPRLPQRGRQHHIGPRPHCGLRLGRASRGGQGESVISHDAQLPAGRLAMGGYGRLAAAGAAQLLLAPHLYPTCKQHAAATAPLPEAGTACTHMCTHMCLPRAISGCLCSPACLDNAMGYRHNVSRSPSPGAPRSAAKLAPRPHTR
jgi:hypothetical protein